MVAEIDIYRTAMLYVKQHGARAEEVAAKRADDLWTADDAAGARTWLHIRQIIRELATANQSGRDCA